MPSDLLTGLFLKVIVHWTDTISASRYWPYVDVLGSVETVGNSE